MKDSPKQIAENQIAEWIAPLGYEVVAFEATLAGQRKLRLFIDRTTDQASKGAVGIEDCVAVTKAINEQLDTLPAIEKLFQGHSYDLEVSSPGIDRPLRSEQDFERFTGKMARIHVFRPLNSDEIGNTDYLSRNPKQKNFVGTLKGLTGKKLLLAVQANPGRPESDQPQVNIPLELIAKANLEPTFDFEERKSKS
jgi:ribosome maturation factor RimP